MNSIVRLLGKGGGGRIFFRENNLIRESACRCTIVENYKIVLSLMLLGFYKYNFNFVFFSFKKNLLEKITK